jgi:16S rRNA (cytosine1402-N4)-methyltransferase
LLTVSGFKGRVIGIDRDSETAKMDLDFPRFDYYQANFNEIPEVLSKAGVSRLSGVLFDFGLSSLQLDNPSRGFSFQSEGPLDMRFDLSQILTAEKVLNEYPEEKLTEIFRNFGEEPKARNLARFIVAARKKEKISATGQLRQLLLKFWKRPNPRRFLARIFQALRMEVNQELENIRLGLAGSLPFLESGGRLVAISYHSLEDRTVKEFFRRESKDCICPPEFPVCRCGHRAALKVLTAKPAVPSAEEQKENPRSASARLRAAEKL